MRKLTDDLIERLMERLRQPLPGQVAHRRLSPLPVNESRFNFRERPDARQSAVLVLLHPGKQGIHFPLIQRPVYPGAHSGQVSLPGGKMEPEDADLIQTALREAQEEIGADPSAIKVVGCLSDIYIPDSHFRVLPVVGITGAHPVFVPDQKEVERVLTAHVDGLLNQTVQTMDAEVAPNVRIRAPYYTTESDGGVAVVWGATAMMLAELLQIMQEIEGNEAAV